MIEPAAADGVFSLLWLIIALPALGAAVILLVGGERSRGWAHLLGCGTVIGSFAISLLAFVALLGRDPRTAASRSSSTPGWMPAASGPTCRCCSTRCRPSSCC